MTDDELRLLDRELAGRVDLLRLAGDREGAHAVANLRNKASLLLEFRGRLSAMERSLEASVAALRAETRGDAAE